MSKFISFNLVADYLAPDCQLLSLSAEGVLCESAGITVEDFQYDGEDLTF